jgi:putative photosynthetic complex assembly protein
MTAQTSNQGANHRTSAHREPKGLIVAIVTLLSVIVTGVAVSRATGWGHSTPTLAPELDGRNLLFADGERGAILIKAAETGTLVATIQAGTHGFIRNAVGALARERQLRGIDETPPFRLSRQTDGRMWLTDSATGQRIDLDAFGTQNTASFTQFLPERRRNP